MRTLLSAAIAFLAAMLAACTPFASRSMPPIIGAARAGDTALVEKLLTEGADPNVHAGVNNWTPLMHAIHKNQAGSVRVLLVHGAAVNERGDGGMTALIMAAGYGYAGIVEMLLKAGADPNAKTGHGIGPLAAAVGGVPDIDRFTVGRCQTDTVRALLAASNLNRAGQSGLSSALHIARLGGCAEVTRLVAALR